jgi:hypothetical protein
MNVRCGVLKKKISFPAGSPRHAQLIDECIEHHIVASPPDDSEESPSTTWEIFFFNCTGCNRGATAQRPSMGALELMTAPHTRPAGEREAVAAGARRAFLSDDGP